MLTSSPTERETECSLATLAVYIDIRKISRKHIGVHHAYIRFPTFSIYTQQHNYWNPNKTDNGQQNNIWTKWMEDFRPIQSIHDEQPATQKPGR